MTTSDRSKIPTWYEISERLRMGQPHPILISDDPEIQVVVEPALPGIGLIAPDNSQEFAERQLAKGLRFQSSGPGRSAIWIDDVQLLELGWNFLSGLAEEILAGKLLRAAVAEQLGQWRDLVARWPATALTAAVGVLGELAVMKAALANGHTPLSWVGRDGGPIDFRFDNTECEVKTTTGVRHEHIINGADQMQPSPGAMLLLLSLRVSPAEHGVGSSVSSLAQDVCEHGIDKRELADALRLKRGVDLLDPASNETFILRSRPYVVDAALLPVITTKVLVSGLGREAVRIREVSYRLDIEGLQLSESPIGARIADAIEL